MATQHPDSASRYVPVQEEVEEALDCLKPAPEGLGCEEYMVDYEGKMTPYHQTAQIVSRLETEGLAPGREVFVTPRIPSATEENVFRQLMTILSVVEANFEGEDSAVKEVVHPMTKSAEELVETRERIDQAAQLAKDSEGNVEGSDIALIPLIEGVSHLVRSGEIVGRYVGLCRDRLDIEVERVRVMLGRSDPALQYGMVPAVIADKLAVADLHGIDGVEVGPIFGGGYLPFRGHVSEDNVERLAEEFAGIRTATVQSGIRYDRGREATQELADGLRRILPGKEPLSYSDAERELLVNAAGYLAEAYLPFLYDAAWSVAKVADLMPSQRDRLTRTGAMGYPREAPDVSRLAELCSDEELAGRLNGLQRESIPPLPRAIKYTAALYTIGVPPEFVGTGRGIEAMDDETRECLLENYGSLEGDLQAAATYLNLEIGETFLSPEAFELVRRDVEVLREYFDLEGGARDEMYGILTETMRPILKEVLSGESEIIVDGEAERELLTNWIQRLGEMRGSLG